MPDVPKSHFYQVEADVEDGQTAENVGNLLLDVVHVFLSLDAYLLERDLFLEIHKLGDQLPFKSLSDKDLTPKKTGELPVPLLYLLFLVLIYNLTTFVQSLYDEA